MLLQVQRLLPLSANSAYHTKWKEAKGALLPSTSYCTISPVAARKASKKRSRRVQRLLMLRCSLSRCAMLVGYANYAAALVTRFKSCAAKTAAEKHRIRANSHTYIQAVVHAFHASQQGLHFKPCKPPHHIICLTTRAACRSLASATPPKKTSPAVLFTSCIVAPTT